MAKKNARILTLLGAAVGTGLAVFGIRKGMQWYQQRQSIGPLNGQIPATGLMEAVAPQDMAALEEVAVLEDIEIPDTTSDMELANRGGGMVHGGMTAGTSGMSAAEQANSDLTDDFDDRGTASVTSEVTGDTAATGINMGINTGQFSGADQQANVGQQTGAEQPTSGQRSAIVLDEFVAPLIEHAIALNSVMNLLRSRQREGVGNEGIESLTEGDRNSMRAVLAQMQERTADYDPAALRSYPLAQHTLDLTNKLRDALDNTSYSGADLYRLYEEIGKELCTLTRQLADSHQVTITGLDQIRQLYECK